MMQKVDILKLSSQDTELLKACSALDRLCLPSEAWSFESFRAETEKPSGIVLAAVNQDSVLTGFLTASCIIDTADLTNIAVSPACRRQGIAGMLLQALFSECGQADIFLEVRESNQNAIALYQKYQFRKVGIRKNFYHNPEENAILMQYGGNSLC